MSRAQLIFVSVFTECALDRRIEGSRMSGYHDVRRDEICHLLPTRFSTVMDIGCGSGVTLKWIEDRFPDVRVIGIEANRDAAMRASEIDLEVINTNIEENDAFLSEYAGKIDVLLLLDILEHLRDPWAMLERLEVLLSSSGIVIASIPNVRNLKVILPLIFIGRWSYSDSGILDRTHLRFFTRSSMISLFDGAGFEMLCLEVTGPLKFNRVRSWFGLFAYILNLITFGVMKDLVAHQFILSARRKGSV